MELNYAHLCDHAVIDVNGKISLIGVFDTLRGAAVGATALPKCFLVASFLAPVTEGAQHDMQLAFVDEDGHELVPRINVQLRLSTQGPRRPLIGNLLVQIEGVPFPKPGPYQIEFHAQSRRIGELPVIVMPAGAAPARG